jgi:hypothetical protein
MDIIFDKPTLYLSHAIRGDGSKTMQENCRCACRVADKIERVFPEINLYVPARSDLSLQVLWDAKKISIEDIMYADLEILRACHGWMWYYTGDSLGCEEEEQEAIKMGFTGAVGMSGTIFTDILKARYGPVRRLLNPIVEQAKRRFKSS